MTSPEVYAEGTFSANRDGWGAGSIPRWYGRFAKVLRPEKGRRMSSHAESSPNDLIDAILRAEPPVPGAALEGWVTFCDGSSLTANASLRFSASLRRT